MNDVDCFVELLAARLTLNQGALPALAARDAVYRADALFEAGADLSDSLRDFEGGVVGSSVVLEMALRTAQLAAQLYLATTGRDAETMAPECREPAAWEGDAL